MQFICTSIITGTLLLAGTSFAGTINVPSDHALIQDAINAAENGDSILVQPGTYTGTGEQVVHMWGKSITLIAAGSPESTVIDGEGQRRCITCSNSEGMDTRISGFTITNGNANSGAGIYLGWASSPTIENCIVADNIASSGGAGLEASGSNSVIRNCMFINNTSHGYYGGGLRLLGVPGFLMYDCIIRDNTAPANYGGVFVDNYFCGMTNSVICGNSGPSQMYGADLNETVLLGECEINHSGDLDGDFVVDVNDVLQLIEVWGSSGPGFHVADFDYDGDVGINDLLYIISVYGANATPTGACCVDECWCKEGLTESDCDSWNGTWWGPDTQCGWCGGEECP
ncbi:MAG: right-handed parallel beta-helix repeat-containing protein [Phycisphaerales bacterium]|nr:right-handed parallel beta-helix repeat-containing protein [Phycisphaerales bacterium]